MTLRQLHRISGSIIALFAIAHISNHLGAIFGVDKHIAMMRILRGVHRNPVIETLLLSAVVSQMITGLKMAWRSRGQSLKAFNRIQVYSGLYLAFFLLIHCSAVLIGRNLAHLDTNFFFASAGLLQFPWTLFFMPYYFFAVVALFSHAGCALRSRAIRMHSENAGTQWFYVLVSLGILIATILVSTFSGQFYSIDLPKEYALWPTK